MMNTCEAALWRGGCALAALWLGFAPPTAAQTQPLSESDVSLSYDTRNFTLEPRVQPLGTGTIVRSPDAPHYPWGTEVTVEFTPAVAQAFTQWQGSAVGTEPTTVVDLRGSTNAHFAIALTVPIPKSNPLPSEATLADFNWDTRNFTLEPRVQPLGAGTIVRTPDAPHYPWGTTVTVEFTPAVAQAFTQWQGSAVGTEPTAVVDLRGSTNAHFAIALAEPIPNPNPLPTETTLADLFWDTRNFTLITRAQPLGSATLTTNPSQPHYPWGTEVEVHCRSGLGFRMASWGGAASGTSDSVLVRMTDQLSTEVIAFQVATNTPPDNLPEIQSPTFTWDTRNFTLEPRVQPLGAGTIVRTPDAPHYPWGTTVTVEFTPAVAQAFTQWQGSAVGTEPTTVVDLRGATNAHFAIALAEPIPNPNPLPTETTLADLFWDTRNFTLITRAQPLGAATIVCTPDAPHYPWGTTVTVEPLPAIGMAFFEWNIQGAFSQTALQSVTMGGPDTDWLLVASFNSTSPDHGTLPSQFALTQWDSRNFSLSVQIQPSGSATVTRSPDLDHYCWGHKVLLSANPADGFRLDKWLSDHTGYATVFTQRMEHQTDLAVQALFVQGSEPADPFQGWLIRHFGTLDAAPQHVLKNGNFIPIAQAYLLSDNPHDAADFTRLSPHPQNHRNLNFELETLPNRFYQVEFSNDLSPNSWAPLGETFVGDGYPRQIHVTPQSTDPLFLRVTIQAHN